MALPEFERAKCMAALARSLGADRAVVVTIAPFVPRKLLLSALVVGRDGSVIQSLNAVEYPRAAGSQLERAIESALSDFIPRLDFSSNPVPPQLSAQAISSAPEQQVLAHSSPTGRQNLAVGGLFLGAAFLGLGTWGMFESTSRYHSIDDAYAHGALPPQADKEQITNLRNEAQRTRGLGLVGLGLGAAAVGTSIFLLATTPDPEPAKTTLLVGPTAVGLSIPLR
jgi:hypothetical protein